MKKLIIFIYAVAFLSACSSTQIVYAPKATNTQPTAPAIGPTDQDGTPTRAPLPRVEDFQALAAKFNYRIEVPHFESTPDELKQSVTNTLLDADKQLQAIAKRPKDQMTFENTIRALDDAFYDVGNAATRLSVIASSNPDPKLRSMADEQGTLLKQWFTGFDYRADVYEAVKAFRDQNPELQKIRPDLSKESLKFYDQIWREYTRAGLTLPDADRKSVEEMRKRIDALTTAFDKNIREDKTTIEFTAEELTGVPADLLQQFAKTQDGKYVVVSRLPTHSDAIQSNAISEDVRMRHLTSRYQVAMKENTPILEETIKLRDQIAQKLGYGSWDDYQLELKMAKTAPNAIKFLTDLTVNLKPKMQSELAEMLPLKRRDTGNPNAEFKIWDYYYYMNQLQKEKYNVDTEQLKVFFPADKVLAGMFQAYGKTFRLKFTEVQAPNKWVPEVRLFMVQDSATQEPLGLVYFDLFPRDGKYDHFAQFGITNGKRFSDGTYQRPVVAIIGNFPEATADAPSLLGVDDVQTMFHEFGHALHSTLTQADYQWFSGTSVQADFVEAPSQMLEKWVLQKEVLDLFAADYRDPSKKIDEAMLDQMQKADLGVKGIWYIRQLALALTDLKLHDKGDVKDSAAVANDTFTNLFLALPPNTNFNASWGHIMGGYDAGYYGYAWADVIAWDMFSPFQSNPNGYLDSTVGMRLRKEIYSVGGSRDAAESVEAFLGRPYSAAPFLKRFGIEAP